MTGTLYPFFSFLLPRTVASFSVSRRIFLCSHSTSLLVLFLFLSTSPPPPPPLPSPKANLSSRREPHLAELYVRLKKKKRKTIHRPKAQRQLRLSSFPTPLPFFPPPGRTERKKLFQHPPPIVTKTDQTHFSLPNLPSIPFSTSKNTIQSQLPKTLSHPQDLE